MTIWNIEGVKAEMLPTSFISALSRESIGLRGLSIDGRISREAVECVANIEGLRILKLFVNSPMIRANFEKLMGLAGVTSSTFACHARPRLNSGA